MAEDTAAPPQDLPVAVCLPDPLGQEVRAWVEGELGWQVVPAGGPPRPALTLRHALDARPGCVVVTAGEVEAATLRLALDAGALDAIGWPQDRYRLPELARQPSRSPQAGGPPVWRVAGTGGGVGTSTVALGVAGLAAWSGKSVVVVGGDDLLTLCGAGPWEGAGLAEIAALGPVDGAAELPTLAREVVGVDGLTVLGGRVSAQSLDVSGWPADLVVVDAGVHDAGADGAVDVPDALVTSPDARAARARDVDAPLLVVGDGPLDRGGVRSACGRRPAGWLPASARVARAALQGRVPAGVPGSWLRVLRDAVTGRER
jgi:hypothetical protein